MYTYPSASTWPMSPSDSQPSGALRAVRADVPVRGRGARAPAHPDLSFLTGRNRSAVGVADLYLAQHRPAHGPSVSEPFGPSDHRHGLQFGASVQFQHLLRAEPVDPRLLEPRRARRGHMEGHLQGGNVGGQAHRFRQTPVHDGGAFQGREPVGDWLRHGPERPGREQALHEPDRVGQADGDHRALHHPAGREQRSQTLHPRHELSAGQRHISARQRRPTRIGVGELAKNGEEGSPLHLHRTYTRSARPRYGVMASGRQR